MLNDTPALLLEKQNVIKNLIKETKVGQNAKHLRIWFELNNVNDAQLHQILNINQNYWKKSSFPKIKDKKSSSKDLKYQN